MFILGNLIIALAKITDVVLMALGWCILLRALISWVNPDPFNPIVQFLNRVTEPILYRIRRIVPPISGIDISPVVAFLLIISLQLFLVKTLYDIGYRLQ